MAIGIGFFATTVQAQQAPPVERQLAAAEKLDPLELPPLPRKEVPTKKFGDWTQHCNTRPGGQERKCFMVQTVVQTRDDKKHGLLAITIGLVGPENKPVMALRLPLALGVLLPPGLKFNVNGIEPGQIAVQSCLRIGCIAKTPLSPETVAAMKKANTGSVEVHTIRKKVLRIPVSFKGFTAALASLGDD